DFTVRDARVGGYGYALRSDDRAHACSRSNPRGGVVSAAIAHATGSGRGHTRALESSPGGRAGRLLQVDGGVRPHLRDRRARAFRKPDRGLIQPESKWGLARASPPEVPRGRPADVSAARTGTAGSARPFTPFVRRPRFDLDCEQQCN